MKLRMVSLLFLLICLTCLPALADVIYDNGPINGTVDAWDIKFGFAASDTFTIGADGATLNGLIFGAWLAPGDQLHSVEVSITSAEFGGTTYLDQIVSITQSNCSRNQYSFDVCIETGSFSDVNLASGTYWLNLQNGVSLEDVGVFWDENSGPSQASQNSVGTIPSEAFTLLGTNGTTSTTGTVPEPSTVMLFGSGILGLAGLLRRKLF